MSPLLPSVTIYSRPDCHLCGVVHRIALRLQHELPFRLHYVDIETDSALTARYGSRIPVILIDGHEAFAGKITPIQLRKAVQRARWRSPVSRILSRVVLALTRWRSFL